MRCSKCGGENAERVKFCAHCGARFVPVAAAVEVAGEDGVYYCHRHKKVTTRITCGRCEKPICDKCMVNGPAGVRCRECAKNRVAVRWRGVAHDATSKVGRIDGSKVWYLYILSMIVRFFTGWFR